MPNRWTDQMYDHILNVVRGPAPMHRLDYFGPAADNADYARGSLVSAGADGKIVAGCAAGSVGNRPMPMFAIQGTDDLDVYTDDYNVGDATPSAVVATGGFEVATTEFVTGTYTVGDLLKPSATAVGKVEKAGVDAYGTTPIVGVVSVATDGVSAVNEIGVPTSSNYKKPLLTFWTVYLPAKAE